MNNFKLIKFINFQNHNIHLVCNIFHHIGIPKINMQCKQQTAINEMPFINYTLVENLIITRLQTLHAQFFFSTNFTLKLKYEMYLTSQCDSCTHNNNMFCNPFNKSVTNAKKFLSRNFQSTILSQYIILRLLIALTLHGQ